MTKRTHFPIANMVATALALLFLFFLFTAPRKYLVTFTAKLRDKAREAEYAVLGGDMEAVDTAAAQMCADFEASEQPLKLFLNHEDVNELRASIFAVRDLTMIDERGNLLSELQNVFRIIDHLDASETLNLYNLF